MISNLKILSKINEIIDGLNTHTANKNNPHNVTAEQLGLATAYVYKGSVTNFSDLPTNAQNGWVYSVENEHTDSAGILHPAGANFAWNGSKWDDLGGSLSGYAKSVNSQSPDNKGNVNLTLVESLEKNTEDKLVVHNSDGSIQELEVGKKYTINNNPPDSNDNYDVGEFEGYWKSNESVSVGDVRFLKGRNNTKYLLECVQEGTTGTEQPNVSDNTDNIIANYTSNDRIGHMRLIFNLAEKDEDELIALGVAYNRITYSELWNYVQSRPNLVISEEEWQAKFTETNGKFVPYYSSGNGTTTFRTPLLSAYIKGADSVDNVGTYLSAGLPNIEGNVRTGTRKVDEIAEYATDAFKITSYGVASNVYSDGSNAYRYQDVSFDASLSNSIYGSSETVQPESMTGIWVIKALGIITNNEGTDIASIANRVEKLEAGAISVGFEYFSTNPNIPDGSIPLFGGEYSRTTYKDLWEWVQTQAGYLLTEEEWQAKSAENDGNVPFYSKGNGSTTFRVPSLKCWIKGANGIEEVGSYLQAGLPNITGEFGGATKEGTMGASGAFSVPYQSSSGRAAGSGGGIISWDFDASRSNSIYGNSETVQPKSIVGMWLVKAYGTVTNVGSTDVADIASGLTELETRTSAHIRVVESYRNGTEWYRVWSDGWVEQGGIKGKYSENAVLVTLLKPYSDNLYTVQTTAHHNGSANQDAINDKTTTTFYLVSVNWSPSYLVNWYACGMGA